MEHRIKEYDSLMDLLEDLDAEGITGFEKRRIMENFLMRKSRLHGKPYCASFELTPLCNFDCKMCYMHLTKEQMEASGRMLSTDEWLSIACQAVDLGVTSIDLTGGECLSYPGFTEIYLYLVRHGIHVSILTNGQMITREHVRLFSEYKPSVVQMSLYGSNREAYVRVTGRDAFDDVMNAVSMLKEAGIRVRFSVTPHRYMQDDAPAMIDLLHRLNIDYTIGSTTLTARPETGREIADYIVDNQAYVEICKLENDYRRMRASDQSLKHQKPFSFRIKGQNGFEGPPCAAGSAHFHLNWKGEMMPCIGFHTVTRSVLNEGVEAAWRWIRDTMKTYRLPKECGNCKYNEVCIGCSAEKSAGALHGPVNQWVCKRLKASISSK